MGRRSTATAKPEKATRRAKAKKVRGGGKPLDPPAPEGILQPREPAPPESLPVHAKPERLPLVDYGLANTAIVRQLALLERVCFNADPDFRQAIVDTVSAGLKHWDADVNLKAASVGVRLVAVNASVLKSLASDQLQRHLTFEQKQEERTKVKALEDLTVEELEALEAVADKLGGKIEIHLGEE